MLKKIFGYNPYIIEGKNNKGFHAFCQVYKNKQWFYVDARGVTTSFDEFMEVASKFVTDEYIIRPITDKDLVSWEIEDFYNKEGYNFAEAIIKKFKLFYSCD